MSAENRIIAYGEEEVRIISSVSVLGTTVAICSRWVVRHYIDGIVLILEDCFMVNIRPERLWYLDNGFADVLTEILPSVLNDDDIDIPGLVYVFPELDVRFSLWQVCDRFLREERAWFIRKDIEEAYYILR